VAFPLEPPPDATGKGERPAAGDDLGAGTLHSLYEQLIEVGCSAMTSLLLDVCWQVLLTSPCTACTSN